MKHSAQQVLERMKARLTDCSHWAEGGLCVNRRLPGRACVQSPSGRPCLPACAPGGPPHPTWGSPLQPSPREVGCDVTPLPDTGEGRR